MKVEYDPEHDLLYVWFGRPGTQAARTEVLSPGVHADFTDDDRLLGIEVIEAQTVPGDSFRLEFSLPKAG